MKCFSNAVLKKIRSKLIWTSINTIFFAFLTERVGASDPVRVDEETELFFDDPTMEEQPLRRSEFCIYDVTGSYNLEISKTTNYCIFGDVECCSGMVWLNGLKDEIILESPKIILNTDNIGALQLTKYTQGLSTLMQWNNFDELRWNKSHDSRYLNKSATKAQD
uniref:Uncharacterized protein n=1 Tax=Megaselia scalaris TaxID=36166 RepID=T1GRQ1_MEGSC